MSNMNKRFSSKSNVRRAARADGVELDQINIEQDGAQFYYVMASADPDHAVDVIESADADDAELTTNGTPCERVLELTGADGESYGRTTEADGERMARMLADSEHQAISVRDMTAGADLLTVEYHTEETCEVLTPDTLIEVEHPAVIPVQVEPAQVEDVTLILRLHAPHVAVPADKADSIAAAVAKILRSGVDVYDATGETLLHTIVHKAAKTVAPKAEGVKRAKKDLPSGKLGTIVAMCMREEGANTAEMLSATGWAKMPAKSMVKGLGDKYGLTFANSKVGKEARYFLYREDAEAAA